MNVSIPNIKPAQVIDFFKKVDKKTWIQLGAAAVGLLVLAFVVVWPAWFKRLEIRKQIKMIEGQIQSVETLSLKKAEWLKNKESYFKLIQGAKGRLHQPGETALLLGAISKLAKESGVSIVSSQPKESASKFPPPFDGLYEASLYDFTIEGGYHDLGKFASQVESNPKLLRIQVFNLKPKEGTPKIQTAGISLSAVSFKKGASQ